MILLIKILLIIFTISLCLAPAFDYYRDSYRYGMLHKLYIASAYICALSLLSLLIITSCYLIWFKIF
jgi:hypothetical protein